MATSRSYTLTTAAFFDSIDFWLDRFIEHWDIELVLTTEEAHKLESLMHDLHTICRYQPREVHIHIGSTLHRERS